MKCLFPFLLLIPVLLLPAHAAETRHALVMGVWEYKDPTFPALPGIDSDVGRMATKLKSLGFTVSVVTNPTLGRAKQEVDDFGAVLLAGKGTGLFYFSGHGCENDGKNYLIPQGTSIRTRGDLDDEALSAQRVLTRMEEAGTAVNLVFLDCCRNALTKGTGDLAPMRATGTFIGFATASAKVAGASDEGSAYTGALLEFLDTPGLSILDMHTRVTKRVKEMTAGTQIPFQYSGLDVSFAFVPTGPDTGTMAPAAPAVSEAEIQRRVAAELARRMSTSVPPSGGAGIPDGPTEVTGEQRVRSFIQEFCRALESGNPDVPAAFFASSVDYYDQGVISRAQVRRDLGNDASTWEQRSFQIGGEITVESQGGSYHASFPMTYRHRNGSKSASGDLQMSVTVTAGAQPSIRTIHYKLIRAKKDR